MAAKRDYYEVLGINRNADEKEIKKAYYQYCQSSKTVEIRENAVKVAGESFRINQSLLKNGKTNNNTVLRSENEVTRAEAALF